MRGSFLSTAWRSLRAAVVPLVKKYAGFGQAPVP
jgi:hypothetical protein